MVAWGCGGPTGIGGSVSTNRGMARLIFRRDGDCRFSAAAPAEITLPPRGVCRLAALCWPMTGVMSVTLCGGAAWELVFFVCVFFLCLRRKAQCA